MNLNVVEKPVSIEQARKELWDLFENQEKAYNLVKDEIMPYKDEIADNYNP